MCREKTGGWTLLVFSLISTMLFLAPAIALAGVGGSDVPTVVGPVQVGGTYNWSFTVTNTSTTPNDVHNIQVQTVNNIFFTTTCGTPDPSGICPPAQQEAANTITITPLTGVGQAGTACAGINFTVASTATPNEYVFTPASPVILGPSNPGGNPAKCQVNFTVTLNANPVHDSSASPGLQTSQLARVVVMTDVVTNENGSAAGTSTVTVLLRPDIVTTPNPTEGPVGTVLNDCATLSNGFAPTGTIEFKLYGPTDSTCSQAPIFSKTEPVSGNGNYCTSAGYTTLSPGTYHWIATYSGDSNNISVSSLCANEAVVIGKKKPKIVTVPNPSVGPVGTVLNDSATLSEGNNPTGTITFKLYGVMDPGCHQAPIFTNTVTVNGNGTYTTSAGYTTTLAGTYNWIACYSGDANNEAVCDACGNESVVVIGLTIFTTPEPSTGPIGTVLNDCATLTGGIGVLSGTITFNLYGVSDPTCAGAPIFTNIVPVNGTGTYCTTAGYTTVTDGVYHWVATYSGNASNPSVSSQCSDEAVVIGRPPPPCLGECPYIGIVGNDIAFNPFYFSPKHEQFLYDQLAFSVPVCSGVFPPVTPQTRVGGAGCEQFRSNRPIDQPEVCDASGTKNKFGDYSYAGEPNAVVRKQNAGYFEWFIRLPVKPSGEINLVFQCGVLKPNAFAFEDFDSILVCAAETGERIGTGFCTRNDVRPNNNPIVNTALPRITAIAYPGPYSVGFTPFHLTAYKNPGSYALSKAAAANSMVNSQSLNVLDGSTDARILLKSCMDKPIVAKIPVTGQLNALGEVENDLEAGDIIYVRMDIPGNNTVDIYCNSQSLKISGIGEEVF